MPVNAHETATKEALEEAGLRGRLVGAPLGCYEMLKCGEPYTLVLLLMEVKECEDVWEEAHCRERRWVTMSEARQLLCQPQLRNGLDAAVARLRGKKSDRQKRNLKDDRLVLRQAKSRGGSRTAKRA